MKQLMIMILCVLTMASCMTPKKMRDVVSYTPESNDTVKLIAVSSATLDSIYETTAVDFTEIAHGMFVGSSNIEHVASADYNPHSQKHKKPMGLITYLIPDTIMWGEFASVELRITKNKTATDFVLKNGNAVVDSIRVGNEMSIQLIDVENAFQVKVLSSSVQSVEDGDEFTTWKWLIKPTKSGRHELAININIVGGKDIPVVTYKVFVESEPFKEMIKAKIGNGINWTQILSTIITGILVPLFIFLWKRRKNRKT